MESVFVTLFVCVASYAYNRKSVSFVTPKLIEEGLDRSHAGLIISCQNGAFALSKFLAGLLSDRTNPQLLFIFGLLLGGFTTLLFSASSSVTAFCALWIINGLAQGCGWPSCAKIIRQRASPSKFGTLWSVLSSGNNVSGMLSPFLSTFLVLNYGWRTSVFTAGITSVIVGVIGAFALKLSSDNDHKSEQNIKSPPEKTKTDNEVTFFDLLKDPFLWLVSVGYLVVFCFRTTMVDWGQHYLMEERDRTQHDGSTFTSSIETGGFLGRIAAGYLTDILVRRQLSTGKGGSEERARMSVAMLFMLGSIIVIQTLQITVTSTSSTVWIATLGFMLGMFLYGPIAIFGIVSTESAPPHLSGSSNAVAALAANVGAMISGFPFCYLADHYNWSTVFLLLEVTTGLTLFVLFCSRNVQPKFRKPKKED